MSGKWISIQQYSLNNNVSISTIRRHIKSKKLKSKLDNGKYFVFDPFASDEINSEPIFNCPAIKEIHLKDSKISELSNENQRLKEHISELKMLLKIIEKKSGIKVSI